MSDAVRKPALQVFGDGAPIAGCESVRIVSTSWYQANTFEATFALRAAPAGFWGKLGRTLIDIRMGVGGPPVSVFQGQIDTMDIALATGTVVLYGRDLSERLIETKTQETFQNQTASQIATILAGRHGLTADVTPTTTLAGRYYETDHTMISASQFSRTRTEWDVLTYLAQQEDFDVWVDGQTLRFHPRATQASPSFTAVWTQPKSGSPVSNVINLNLERNMSLARDIQVQVRSWNSQQKRSFTKTAKSINSSPVSGVRIVGYSQSTQNYVFTRPNLTEDQAQKLANHYLAELSMHERKINFEMPGDFQITPRDVIELSGTGTDFDQTYWVQHIDYSISFEQGFSMSVQAKNQDVRTEVVL